MWRSANPGGSQWIQMSESDTWKKLRPLLKGLDPVRVENLVCPGTPDVECLAGWVELKYLPAWPKRPDSIVQLKHFTTVQRAWIIRRVLSGGRCFVVLRVDNEWLLFEGMQAAKFLGVVSRQILYDVSLCHWAQKPDKTELQKWIRISRTSLSSLPDAKPCPQLSVSQSVNGTK